MNRKHRITSLVISLFVALVVGIPLILLAAVERDAAGQIGGEWVAIVGVFMITYGTCSNRRIIAKIQKSRKEAGKNGKEIER